MTPENSVSPVKDPAIHDIMIRLDVAYMSAHLLGTDYSQVAKIIYPSPSYKSFILNKRNGSPRLIQEPSESIKELQLKILSYLELNAASPKPCVHGFTKGRSIVTNALKHCSPNTRFILNLDLENFFPSITYYRVRGLLQKPPFNFAYPVATVLAHICTKAGELPQGAPTSPFIANLICRRLDADLMDLARRNRSTYTRYADDMTFSFTVRNVSRLPISICSFDGGILSLGKELTSTILNHGFSVKDEKTRLSNHRRRLEVTGLTVNSFPNVKRVYVDRIRGALHAWERFGHRNAEDAWHNQVKASKEDENLIKRWSRQRRVPDIPPLRRVLWGKLLYLKMVRGPEDPIYSRLAGKFNSLCIRDLGSSEILPVKNIVNGERDAERATFVVSWSGQLRRDGGAEEFFAAEGTAFAYRSANRFITCEHVFRLASADGQVHYSSEKMYDKELSIHNPSTNTTLPVQLVHFDLERDLAILEVVGPAPDIPYFVARDMAVKTNEVGILIGYPNWHRGKPLNQTRTIVSNQFPRSGLKRVEIGELIRQGNSGGPFVDATFRVCGVAQTGATQSEGNNECLAVNELEDWLLNRIH